MKDQILLFMSALHQGPSKKVQFSLWWKVGTIYYHYKGNEVHFPTPIKKTMLLYQIYFEIAKRYSPRCNKNHRTPNTGSGIWYTGSGINLLVNEILLILWKFGNRYCMISHGFIRYIIISPGFCCTIAGVAGLITVARPLSSFSPAL